MIRRDYHTHTTFCDGKNTAEEMVEAAIALGMDEIGFSGHAHQPFDFEYCMSVENTAKYRAEVLRLREKYKGKINILLGTERDLYTDDNLEWDYTIGSTHYIKFDDGEYVAVDATPETLEGMIENRFGGDALAMCEAYFENVSKIGKTLHPTFIGHFDLVKKFNVGGRFFDESDPRYVAAWQRAADSLLETCRLFEINTGGMARAHQTTPYPSREMIEYIKARGGKFILSSDSHRTDNLCFRFDDYEQFADVKKL